MRAATMLPSGELVVGGDFALAGGLVSARLARLSATCRASAIPAGLACSGSGGAMALSATDLPWLGGTYRAHCTGIVPQSLAVGLLGWPSAGTPLSAIHPAGAAGCPLLTTADAAVLLLPSAGRVERTFDLPLATALVGIVLVDQVVQAEFWSSSLGWLGASNALVLTTGRF